MSSSFDDLIKQLEEAGLLPPDSPLVIAYKSCERVEDLVGLAGARMHLHAVAIMSCLSLPKSQSVLAGFWKRRDPSSELDRKRMHNVAFVQAALLDACAVRDVFIEQEQWPGLRDLLNAIFCTACSRHENTEKLTAAELAPFREYAISQFHGLVKDMKRTFDEQGDKLWSVRGTSPDRIGLAKFVRVALKAPTWIEPWGVIKEFKRLSAGYPR
jgi:hypothetical protein